MIPISLLLVLSSIQSLLVQARPGRLQNVLLSYQSSLTSQNTIPSGNITNYSLHRRQREAVAKTCGYLSGDPAKPRTANAGFGCRVDTLNGLWGFCPTSVIAASDCGLAGACVDQGTCKGGCGKTGISTLTTFTCSDPSAPFCSTAVLNAGPDQLYSYLACGGAIREVFFAAATSTPVASTTTITTSKASTLPKTSSITQASLTSVSTLLSSSKTLDSSSASQPITFPPTTTSSSTNAASNAPDSAETTRSIVSIEATPPNNIGAIVGGALSGIAIICVTVLGMFYLRKYRRDHTSPEGKQVTAVIAQSYAHTPSDAQTAGLHEKDGSGAVFEKDGGGHSRRYTAFEMP